MITRRTCGSHNAAPSILRQSGSHAYLKGLIPAITVGSPREPGGQSPNISYAAPEPWHFNTSGLRHRYIIDIALG